MTSSVPSFPIFGSSRFLASCFQVPSSGEMPTFPFVLPPQSKIVHGNSDLVFFFTRQRELITPIRDGRTDTDLRRRPASTQSSTTFCRASRTTRGIRIPRLKISDNMRRGATPLVDARKEVLRAPWCAPRSPPSSGLLFSNLPWNRQSHTAQSGPAHWPGPDHLKVREVTSPRSHRQVHFSLSLS